MKLPTPHHRRSSESGIALIIVMIAIFVLAALAWKFAAYMKVETTLARNANSEAELEWLGRSGVEYARYVLGLEDQCARGVYSLNQVWAGGTSDPCATNGPLSEIEREVHLGDHNGSFTWKITNLDGKWNINTFIAPGRDKLLEQALIQMGVDPGELPALTGAILDWIDDDERTRLEGAENDYYHGLSPPYDSKDGPVDDLSELLMVRGITPEMFWGGSSTNHPVGAIQRSFNRNGVPVGPAAYAFGLADLFTTFSAPDGRININTASAEVLQIVPGVDPAMAAAIVAGRQGDDDGSGMLGPYPNVAAVRRIPEVSPGAINALNQFCGTSGGTFQVQVDAKIDNYTRQFVAILGRNPRNPREFQVLTFYWK